MMPSWLKNLESSPFARFDLELHHEGFLAPHIQNNLVTSFQIPRSTLYKNKINLVLERALDRATLSTLVTQLMAPEDQCVDDTSKSCFRISFNEGVSVLESLAPFEETVIRRNIVQPSHNQTWKSRASLPNQSSFRPTNLDTTSVDLVLVDLGKTPVLAIKAIREHLPITLSEMRALSRALPGVIAKGVEGGQLRELTSELTILGAQYQIQVGQSILCKNCYGFESMTGAEYILGEPPVVVLWADKGGLQIKTYHFQWISSHETLDTHQVEYSFSWRELPEELSERRSFVFERIQKAAAKKRAECRRCVRCGAMRLPEHMHSVDTCQRCAEQYLGVCYLRLMSPCQPTNIFPLTIACRAQ